VTDDVSTDAHSAGINRELRIVTIPSLAGNLSISWTVDGTALISFSPVRPMMPL
nr:hypothetical protein [Tanacetum cinerariifolium]